VESLVNPNPTDPPDAAYRRNFIIDEGFFCSQVSFPLEDWIKSGFFWINLLDKVSKFHVHFGWKIPRLKRILFDRILISVTKPN
jgi:hypothetical protein